jgi:predicted N-acyltransferase
MRDGRIETQTTQHGMRIRAIGSLAEVAASDWNALDLGGNPLVRHEFLLALEQTGCATGATGWQANHLLLIDGNKLVGALPLYLKPHSWGEFVFDWSWASAYSRSGREYYPKLVSAVPFTPATGSRLLAQHGSAADKQSIREQLIDGLLALARQEHLSSAHLLFTTAEEQQLLENRGFIARCDCQFHWRNDSFRSFDDFIATFRADKRKKALRERRRVAEAGIRFITLRGSEMSAEQWRVAMQLSEATFNSHGHEHYLNVEFFRTVSQSLPEVLIVKFAMLDTLPVAVAIFYQSDDALYGRYWGAAADFNGLHFETCYYQGIDYCIEHGIRHFEPGTQGEHKIARGFAPAQTRSAHWIADAKFAQAIRAHAAQENLAVDRYIAAVKEHLPFHREPAV